MTKTQIKADVVIIGAGPAGLFAAFQAGMLDLSCHLVDALDSIGGQLSALYPEKPIYDIPGFPEILAGELVSMLEAQAQSFSPTYYLGQQVETLKPLPGGRWDVTTSKGTRFDAGAIIIAAGVGAFGPNRPPIDGLEQFEGVGPGNGVNYLVKKRDDFKGKNVVIAGGGDSAVDWAVSLAEVAKSISIVHRRAKFRAQPESVKKMEALAASGKVDIAVPYQLDSINGSDGKINSIVVADLDGNRRELEADVLLAFFGLKQNIGPIADWGIEIDNNHIVADPATMSVIKDGNAGQSGIFAAGDIAMYPGKLKLILTGFAEAARAAYSAREHIYPDEQRHFEYSTSRGVPGSAK